ncbi:MAG: hypothetical protein U1F49_21495 [Rubrivivax sp.]
MTWLQMLFIAASSGVPARAADISERLESSDTTAPLPMAPS